MSDSPSTLPSTKRPLEDPSSPSGPNDQPEAKRPALDKVVRNEDGKKSDTEATSDTKADGSITGTENGSNSPLSNT
jgi:heterogeneous nuclear rnp K-like protein 2